MMSMYVNNNIYFFYSVLVLHFLKLYERKKK